MIYFVFCYAKLCAFSPLSLLVGWQEEHLARKNLSDEVLAGCLSGVKCK